MKNRFNSYVTFIGLIFIAILFPSKSFAQKSIGFKAGLGASILKKDYLEDAILYNNKSFYQPSAFAGFYYKIEPKRWNSFFAAEFLLNQIEGKDTKGWKAYDWSTGLPLTQRTKITERTHILYGSIPLLYGYQYKKLSLSVGFQLNFELLSTEVRKGSSPIDSVTIDTWSFKQPPGITFLDYGLKTGLSYQLSKKFAIDLNYYHGFKNIYRYYKKGYAHQYDWRVRQLMVGMSYKLKTLPKKRKKSW